MKAYAITWDIASYDGDRILSVWLNKNDAEDELKKLNIHHVYLHSVKITEVELNKSGGFDHI